MVPLKAHIRVSVVSDFLVERFLTALFNIISTLFLVSTQMNQMVPDLSAGRFLFIPKHQRYAKKTDISSVPDLSVGRFLSYAKTSALRRKQNFIGSWPISRKVPYSGT